MKSVSGLFLLLASLLLCQCLTEVECRRTTSTSRRGQSNRRNNYGSSNQGTGGSSGFFSFFGSKKPSSSGSSGSSGSMKKTTGWNTASSGTAPKPAGQNPGWANPYYKPSAPKQTGSYGWQTAGSKSDANQFQRSGQPSSNIGPGGYPVQSGFQPASRTPQQHGYNTGFQPAQSHGYQPAQTHGYQPAQSHGYQPAQSHGYQPSHGYQAPPPYSPYPNTHVGQHGFASNHGISPNSYPAQSSFGYPGQGIFGGSAGPKYGGSGIFTGNSGNFGYGSNSWGVPTYGSKASSGKGKLLTGLALGAAGGYLTSSLVNKISNPWGYSGYGYGNRFGYDRPIVIKEIRETTKTETPTAAPAVEPDPTNNWIHCVAFDPSTNVTLINPNCSCTVTTVVDPMTGQPISTHNCTTANGQVLPPQPVPPMGIQPANAVNDPNATPSYGGLYGENMRYGMMPEMTAPLATDPPPPTTSEQESPSTVTVDGTTTEVMQRDSPKESHYQNPSKVKEFFSKLDEITNMGKFS